MKCEVNYCIYNRDFSCILKEIQLDSLGMCKECLIVSIADDVLNELKERQFEELQKTKAQVNSRIISGVIQVVLSKGFALITPSVIVNTLA